MGTRYIFTLGEDNHTTVQAFEHYDNTFERIIQNIAIGTGVILLCVTVSVVSAGAGVAAVSSIFAVSAKTAATVAVSGGLISGVTSGIITGIQTQDFEQSLKAAALAGSEAFKWGAITGAISGGISQTVALKGATTNGLTMNEVAILQKESKYPLDLIKQFHTMEEAEYFTQSIGLKPAMINGQTTLIRGDIDLTLVDELSRSNLTRMSEGLNPIYRDSTGVLRSYEWHHVGQRAGGTLALLTQAEHDSTIIHGYLSQSEINRTVFSVQRRIVNMKLNSFFQVIGGV